MALWVSLLGLNLRSAIADSMNQAKPAMIIVLATTIISCSHQKANVPTASTPAEMRSFLDLVSGWRLRIVVPILKNGQAFPDLRVVAADGKDLSLSSSDFVGHETQIFQVSGRERLRVRLVTSELNVNGLTEEEREPLREVLRPPRFAAYMRLLYLQRVSTSDHDMAVLAAKSMTKLERLTRSVST